MSALCTPLICALWRASRSPPLFPPTYTVIEAATGVDHGTWDTWEEVAMCLAFARLSYEEVEIVTDVSAMATLTGY